MTSRNKNIPENKRSNDNINSKNSWIKKVKKPIGYKEFNNNKKIFLLLDCSGSMTKKHKFNQAKNGLLEFTNRALEKNYIIGLISFDSEAKCLIEPSIDKNNVEKLSNTMNDLIPQGSTNMSNAINIALEKFNSTQSNNPTSKIICIITDGMLDNRGRVKKSAKKAAENKIEIMTVGTDDADLKFLQAISSKKSFATSTTPNKLKDTIISMSDLLPPG